MDKAIKSDVARDDKGYFLPGRAPKSPGAPKQSEATKKARKAIKKALAPLQGTLVEQFKQLIEQAVPRLQTILADPSTQPKDILAALEFVAQYTLGKPSQKSEIVATVSQGIDATKLSTDELKQILSLAAKAKAL